MWTTSHWRFVRPGIAALMFLLLLPLFRCAQDNPFADEDGMVKIDSISPASGIIGTKVRIYGKGFSSIKAENKVTLNGGETTIDTSSVGTILITIPQTATTGPISVTVGSRTAQGPVFTVVAPPEFSGLQPNRGIAGTSVIITGTNLDHVTSVQFNGVPATISQRNNSQLQVQAPTSSTGAVTLVYIGGTINGPVFTYLPIPLIQTVETFFTRQTYLIIRGINFRHEPATLKVLIEGVETAIVAQELDPEPSQLAVNAPGPTTPNPFNIVVEVSGVKSAPYIFTLVPNLSSFAYQQTGTSGSNITLDFTITGGYFGNAGGNRSVEIRNPTTNEITTAVIQSWGPELITGNFTVNPSTLGPNDLYVVTVVVNGVRSNEEYFRP